MNLSVRQSKAIIYKKQTNIKKCREVEMGLRIKSSLECYSKYNSFVYSKKITTTGIRKVAKINFRLLKWNQ